MYNETCNSLYIYMHFANTNIYAIMSTHNKHLMCVCNF